MYSDICRHSNIDHSKIKKKDFTYCPKCGSIGYKSTDTKVYFAIKPKFLNYPIDFSVLDVYNSVKKDRIYLQSWYIEIRPTVMEFLENYYSIYTKHYNDNMQIFYLAMKYIDIIFNKISKKLDDRTLNLYIIASLLLAVKFNELDMSIIYYKNFINEKYYIYENDIIKAEIDVLKLLEYKLNEFTSYDLIALMEYNGLFFKEEMNGKPDGVMNLIYAYINKIHKDVMLSDISLFYSPLEISLSLVRLARIKFNIGNKYEKYIMRYYSVHKSDFIDCFNKIHELENNSCIYNANISIQPKRKALTSCNIRSFVNKGKTVDQNKDSNFVLNSIQEISEPSNNKIKDIQLDISTKTESPKTKIKFELKCNDIKKEKLDLQKKKKNRKIRSKKSYSQYSSLHILLGDDNKSNYLLKIFRENFSQLKYKKLKRTKSLYYSTNLKLSL